MREDDSAPPERLLQLFWFHQRILRDKLVTLDGQPVQVLHPGFWNHEGGPDFRGAIVQAPGEAARSGDVEVDLHSSGWHSHGHDRNPAFKNVVLHVVWEGDARNNLPTLPIKSLLDAPLNDLVLWLGSEAAQAFPENLLGQCSAPLRGLPAAKLTDLLHQAALVRLRGKAVQLQARARQAGWEQALWEGGLRALGYKHNIWPMQRLAELRARICPPETKVSPIALQARLLGIGGLLPNELTRQQASADNYLRRLWDHWWRERETFSDCALPRTLWRFHGLRPTLAAIALGFAASVAYGALFGGGIGRIAVAGLVALACSSTTDLLTQTVTLRWPGCSTTWLFGPDRMRAVRTAAPLMYNKASAHTIVGMRGT